MYLKETSEMIKSMSKTFKVLLITCLDKLENNDFIKFEVR